MSSIGVHPRVTERHPEVADEDVAAVMRSMIRYSQRPSGEWLAVGLDGNSRLVELVYQYDEEEDFFFVFHGTTPPSGKTYANWDWRGEHERFRLHEEARPHRRGP